MKPYKGRLLRDLMSLCSGEAVSKLTGFIAFAYLARTLGPDSYGLVELAVALSVFFMMVIDFGYGPIGAREISKDTSKAKIFTARIVSARLILALIFIPIMGITGYIIAKNPDTNILIWWFAIALIAVPWDHQWLLQGLEQMGAIALGRTIRMAVFAIGVITFVHTSDDYWIVGAVELLAAVFMIVYFVSMQFRHIGFVGFDFRIKPLYSLSKQSGFIGLSQAVWAATQYAPTLIMATLSSAGQLAWFGAAHRVAMSLVAFSLIYHFNLFPSVSKRIKNSPEAFNDFVRPSIKVSAWFGFGSALAVLLVSEPLCEFIFGKEFNQAANVLNVMIWALPLTLLSGHARWALIAAGHQQYVFYAQICGLIATVVSCWILVPEYQATGGAIAVVISTLAVWIVAHFSVRSKIGSIPFIEATIRPLLMVMVSLYIYSLINHPWLASVTAIFVYIAGALFTDWKLPGDIRKLIRIKDSTPHETVEIKYSTKKSPVFSKRMKMRVLFSIFCLILFLAIIQAPQALLARWLNPQAINLQIYFFEDGVGLLKYLLALDIVIIFSLMWLVYKYTSILNSTHPPLWEPRPILEEASVCERYFYQILFILMLLALLLRSPTLDSEQWSKETGVYALAILFSVASIWLTGYLVRYIFSAREALIVAALLSVSYHQIWVSQNAQGYAIAIFGTVLATQLLIRSLEFNKWRLWFAYAFVIAMTTWVQITTVFIAFAHGLVCLALITRTSNLNKIQWHPFWALLLSAWFTIHLYILKLPKLVQPNIQFNADSTTIAVVWQSPLRFITETLLHLGINIAVALASGIVAIIVVGWGLLYCIKRDAVFTALTLLPPIILSLTIFFLGHSISPWIIYAEFGFYSALAVVSAIGFGQLIARVLKRTNRVITLAPVTLLLFIFCYIDANSI